MDQITLEKLRTSIAGQIADGAPVLVAASGDDGEYYICRPLSPGRLGSWVRVGELMDRMRVSEDEGRATLAELWPEMPKRLQAQILSVFAALGLAS